MMALKYLLLLVGSGLLGSAGVLVAYDVFLSGGWRRLLARERADGDAGSSIFGQTGGASGAEAVAVASRIPRSVRWKLALQLVGIGVVAMLAAESFVVIPDGAAGVRVSELWGVRPGTLYPGLHLVTPLVDSVAIYDTREQVYATMAAENPKPSDAGKRVDAANLAENGGRTAEVLTVQA